MADNDIELLIKLNDQVTKGLQDIKGGLKDLSSESDTAGKKSSQVFDNLKKNWLVASAALAGLVATMSNFVEAQREAEVSSAKLAAALKNQGIYSAQLQAEMEAYSQTLQEVTLYEDDQITAVQARLVSAGLQGKALKEITKLTLDYAAATGTDAESAAQLFSKAAEGNVSVLARAVPAIKNADGTVKSFSDSVAILEKKYGGFSEEVAKTPTAKITQLSNEFGNFKETLGKVVSVGIQPFVVALTWLFGAINKAADPIKYFIGTIVVLGLTLAGVSPILAIFGVSLAAAFWPVTAAVVAIAALVAGITAVINWTKDYERQLKSTNKEIEKHNKQLEDAKKKYGDDSEQVKKLTEELAKLEAKQKGLKDKVVKNEVQNSSSGSTKGGAVTDFNKTEAVDFSKQLDDYTKVQLQMGQIHAQTKDEMLAKEQEYQDALTEMNAVKAEEDLAQTDMKAQALDEWYVLQQEKYAGNADMLAQLKTTYDAQEVALEQQRIAQIDALKDAEYLRDKQRMLGGLQSFINMLDIKKAMTKSQAQDFSNWQNFMAGSEKSKNKEVAAIGKAMAIYDITLKTSQAAMGAYSALAAIPIVGPVLGAIAAAAAISWGAEQVSKVSSAPEPQLAEGGVISATPGGRSVRAAEAGKDEAFLPLDDEATAQRIQDATGGGNNGDLTINIAVGEVPFASAVVQSYKKARSINAVGDITTVK